MEYIVENYEVLPTSEIEKGERAVSISFDDGYADGYYNALPILEEYGVPATFFVSTARIGSSEEDWCNELSRLIIEGGIRNNEVCACGIRLSTESRLDRRWANRQLFKFMLDMDVESRNREMGLLREWSGTEGRQPRRQFRMLNQEELKELSQSPLVTIGSHTVNHPSIGRLSISDQLYELAESKDLLERLTGSSVTQFAYPFGGLSDYSEETMDLLQRLGYERAFSTTRKCYRRNSPYEICRRCVGNVAINELKQAIKSQWNEQFQLEPQQE
ncbi:MAG: polysaccharide deacetylase family protein [Eggerthellaceae bacterium]|nr:polysaccharide deacetylase family protein [Eggerthellaceae bacterium]MBQ9067859.1 polysaccharide deacetylase family protein [Eggerthellaceae bacterium]